MKKKKPASRPRIAVVEDDADYRAIVQSWLRPRYDTMGFDSADEVLDVDPEDFAPDLLITDVKMPGMNGYRLCELLRKHPRFDRLPILFLTGVDSDEGFLLGQEAGASAYLTKPVERARLLERVATLLEKNDLEMLA